MPFSGQTPMSAVIDLDFPNGYKSLRRLIMAIRTHPSGEKLFNVHRKVVCEYFISTFALQFVIFPQRFIQLPRNT